MGETEEIRLSEQALLPMELAVTIVRALVEQEEMQLSVLVGMELRVPGGLGKVIPIPAQ